MEPVESGAQQQQQQASGVDFTDAQFDFAAYIAGYSGFAKVLKCRFIAERCPKLAVRNADERKTLFFFSFFFSLRSLRFTR